MGGVGTSLAYLESNSRSVRPECRKWPHLSPPVTLHRTCRSFKCALKEEGGALFCCLWPREVDVLVQGHSERMG